MKRSPKKPTTKPAPRDSLRAEAEARLALRAPAQAKPLSGEELLHELQVHQIELEMQNEQLRFAQAALEKVRDRYLDLYEFAPVGYLTLTRTGQISDVNFAGASLLGAERKHLLGRRFDRFVAPADVARWQRLFIDLKKSNAHRIEELELQPKDSASLPAQVEGQRKDASADSPPFVRLVLVDLSASKAADEKRRIAAIAFNAQGGMQVVDDAQARQWAFHDPLTNLPNRRLMVDRLHHAMAAIPRNQKCCALLFIDLDNFKTVNDTLGHDIGDQLLQQAAQRLSSCVREGDTVARLGGDEFVVILENLSECSDESANQARSIGEKIAGALNRPYALAGHECSSSASIGVALFNNPHESADAFLRRADLAMYEAKAAGRNALRFFEHTMQAAAMARAALEAELRRALAARELQCHFQLQMDDAGRIPGAEALLRWQHPEHGLMSSAAFIRVAEETGQLVAIGQWMLETVCAQLKTWQGAMSGGHLHLAVNVSARQFRQSNYVEQVRTALARSGIDPGSLTLEFKEKVVLADLDESIVKLAALKKLGVRLAIDNFGMGGLSLSQLAKLPVDQLKIDQSIVHGIGVRPSDKAIVQSLIDATRHLGMEVMAEGVETEAQHAFLERHGCHAFQGYLFGRPVPGYEFERLLTRH